VLVAAVEEVQKTPADHRVADNCRVIAVNCEYS
jgi:hypothetical protein